MFKSGSPQILYNVYSSCFWSLVFDFWFLISFFVFSREGEAVWAVCVCSWPHTRGANSDQSPQWPETLWASQRNHWIGTSQIGPADRWPLCEFRQQDWQPVSWNHRCWREDVWVHRWNDWDWEGPLRSLSTLEHCLLCESQARIACVCASTCVFCVERLCMIDCSMLCCIV